MRRIVIWLSPLVLLAQNAPTSEGIEYFEKNIRPLLAANCYQCHSSQLDKPMAGLMLDTRAGTLRVIVPGKPEQSLMLGAVLGSRPDLKMPPGRKLTSEEIERLAKWIQMGAPDPRTGGDAAAASSTAWENARRHWSFRPVQDPKPPRVSSPDWTSPIDAFIKARLDAKGLTPQPKASKLVLLRRVTYDLTGLPPTPDEVDAFLKDASPKATEKVVDRLLASQQYGERWGRHWLDVVRYADTSGDNSDFPVPAMYRYRNWVIAAFNKDEPYDQFLRDQIAGDIIAARDGLLEKNKEEWQEKIIATGYLANSRRFGSRIQEFHLTIDDTIDNLGKGILGLTIACGRCHDHKFDPVPTSDYYALYGIFKSTNYPHAGTEIYPHTYGFAALNPDQADQLKRFETQLSGLDNRIEDIKAGKIKFAGDDEKRRAEAENQATLRRLSNQYPYLQKAYAVSDGKPVNAKIMVRGEPASLGPEVPRGFLTILGGQKVPPEETGSGRLELAEWITDPKNPLTARVIVNRVWGWHFGQGIVATPDDFGARGEPPTHPELLDYLASRFIEGGWSIKNLHRMIMLTRAYQMSSAYDAASALKDSKNQYLWHFNRRRLDAEEVRDSLLAASANLDPAPGGEFPFAPEMTWRYTQHQPFIGKEQDFANNKRSVYLMQQRIRRQPFLDLFDGPDPNAVTGVRPVTTTALQALYTMNDPFFHAQADALAVRVGMAYGPDLDRLNYAYRLVYGRTPSLDEVRDCRQFLAQARESLAGTAVPEDRKNREALAALMRVLLSANEFVTLD
ncbi:MAG TPA: PSD1 and planctomycete cytochrome C domain-containing protein [Candidatus Acidoferrales bacterium]|nr:PSD1 and planctomycete cytochrome C domain-containing protein [Candidatus Acidoferrales bacterium]